MELKVVVFHKGALAHYKVVKGPDDTFVAHLMRYDGKPINFPPGNLTLKKESGRWLTNYPAQQISNEIGQVIEAKWKDGPVFQPKRYAE